MKTTTQMRREAKQLSVCVWSMERWMRAVFARSCRESSNLRRRGYLALLARFQRLVKLDFARHTANVESAMPLPADVRASVEAGLKNAYGPGVSAVFVQNPTLIGGIRIKLDSDVYDGSVRAGLASLERRF